MATWGGGYGPTPSTQISAESTQRATSDDRRKPQSRQLLSCTKCRERKVKCDRTKPCSACCARGHPKECEFVVGEGNDYSPIQQSYEIRQLRAENQRLKERLQAAKRSHSGDESDDGETRDQKGPRSAVRQKRFKTSDRTDNIYFGTPGLANIVHDFANLQVGAHSLTHTVPLPRPQEMYAFEGSGYPFHVLADWTGEDGAAILARKCLPKREKLYSILDSFQRRAQSCSFPHTPDEVTKKEIGRFLDDAEANAARYPDMLALIFATLATGLQMGEYDRNGGKWVEGSMAKTTKQADVFLAASMQALRMSSFMNQPTLLGIQTLLMIGPYLTNSGRFLDAWTLFGVTIRMAHSIGLHRNPQVLEPAPPLRESMVRRTLWWWMLHMDQQYSVTLGRPLGISGVGDCPAPEPLTTNPTILRLGDFVDHFTILARQILSSDGMMSVARIDEFTDKLVGLWDTMPEALQFNESWLQLHTQLPEWPLEVMSATLFAKVHSFLVLLNRQRVERTQSAAPGRGSPEGMMPPPRSHSIASPATFDMGEHLLHPAPVRGRGLVIDSSCQLLNAFLFYHHRTPAVLISWTMGQQAFNASMILLIDIWETGNEHHQWLVEQAYTVFDELANKGVHKLAALAVERISDGLLQLGNRKEERRRQALSRRSSAQHQQPMLQIDTASMTDWSNDAVMGNTGMYLLEDPGLQSFQQQPFVPLHWNMAGSNGHPIHHSHPPTPSVPSPTVPLSQVTAAPFPVISPPFIAGAIPVTNSPYSVGLQPRMPSIHRRSAYPRVPQDQQQQQQQHSLPNTYSTQQIPHQGQQGQSAFTSINPATNLMSPQHYHQQQAFSQLRGPRHSQAGNSSSSGSSSSSALGTGGGPRGIHKLDRVPGARSQQRRKQQ